MTSKLREYTDYLIQVLDCFDFDDKDWPHVSITDEYFEITDEAPVHPALGELLCDIKERLMAEGEYDV